MFNEYRPKGGWTNRKKQERKEMILAALYGSFIALLYLTFNTISFYL